MGTFGAQLRARRLAAGMSLRDLGLILNYSKSYLSKIENGEKAPSADLARRCDAGLQAGGELAALAARTAGDARRKPRAGGDKNGEWLLRMEETGRFTFDVATDRLPRAAPDAILRGGPGADSVLPLTGDVSELAYGFLASFEFQRRLGQQVPAALLLPTLITQTHAAMGVARRVGGSDRQSMMLVAAQFAQHTAWMAQEAGYDEAALWWTDRCSELAAAAGPADTLLAYSGLRRALVTLYREDAEGTVELARATRENSRASARVRGLAGLREAQGYALAGEARDTELALERAAVFLDRGRREGDDGLAIGTRNVADLVTAIRGWCLVDLGFVSEAAELLGPEVDRIPKTAHRARARFGARLAHAHALAGDLDAACAGTAEVLDAARLVESSTLRHELRRLRGTLARWNGDPRVRPLLPRLATALRS